MQNGNYRSPNSGRTSPIRTGIRHGAGNATGSIVCGKKEYSRRSYEKYLAEKAALKKAEETLGGWKMYYLKHPKKGESMYNAIATTGDVFKTNDKEEFLRFVAEL